jgi:Kelch motif
MSKATPSVIRWGAVGLLGILVVLSCGPAVPHDGEDARAVVWHSGPPLPAPVTNNAVAAVRSEGTVSVFSFLGMDSTKVWSGVTDAAYRWDVGSDAWSTLESVPGPGRLASTAQAVGGRIYLLGGYTVAEDGTERSVPNVDIYDPSSGDWSQGADIPLPTDDAVSGVWRDSLIVLVSGWHDRGNVPNVQIYDPAADRWTDGTEIPGPPVFGHTGAVVQDAIVYIDGTKVVDGDPRFRIESSAWHGGIDPADPTSIAWAELDSHPAPALYRAAGGAVASLALFVGGTDNPYNYDGIGYDGVPSEPVRGVLAFDVVTGAWRDLPAPPLPSMDHRTLGVAGGTVFLVGGMGEHQVVSDHVWYASVEVLLSGPR